jgi:hypothetical protein
VASPAARIYFFAGSVFRPEQVQLVEQVQFVAQVQLTPWLQVHPEPHAHFTFSIPFEAFIFFLLHECRRTGPESITDIV